MLPSMKYSAGSTIKSAALHLAHSGRSYNLMKSDEKDIVW